MFQNFNKMTTFKIAISWRCCAIIQGGDVSCIGRDELECLRVATKFLKQIGLHRLIAHAGMGDRGVGLANHIKICLKQPSVHAM